MAAAYRVIDFPALPAVPCPCGQARRALADESGFPGTLHLTEISEDAQPHYHKRLTETYFILECEDGACLEINDDRIALRPGMAVLIPPGNVHRAVGRMKILNIVVPNFDPSDEYVVGE